MAAGRDCLALRTAGVHKRCRRGRRQQTSMHETSADHPGRNRPKTAALAGPPAGGRCVSNAAGTRAWPKEVPGRGLPVPGSMHGVHGPGSERPPSAASLQRWRRHGRRAMAQRLHHAGTSGTGAIRRTSRRRLSDAGLQSDPAPRTAGALWARHRCRGATNRLLPENLVVGLLQRWLFRASAPNAGSLWEPAPTVRRARCITSGLAWLLGSRALTRHA